MWRSALKTQDAKILCSYKGSLSSKSRIPWYIYSRNLAKGIKTIKIKAQLDKPFVSLKWIWIFTSCSKSHLQSRLLAITQHIWNHTITRIWWKTWMYLFTYFKRRQFVVEKPFGSCAQFLVTGYLSMQFIWGRTPPQALCGCSSSKSGHQQLQVQASHWSTTSFLSG